MPMPQECGFEPGIDPVIFVFTDLIYSFQDALLFIFQKGHWAQRELIKTMFDQYIYSTTIRKQTFVTLNCFINFAQGILNNEKSIRS